MAFVAFRPPPAATSPRAEGTGPEPGPKPPTPAKRRAPSAAPEAVQAPKRPRAAPVPAPSAAPPPPTAHRAPHEEEVANALLAMAAQPRQRPSAAAPEGQVTRAVATATLTTATTPTASTLPLAAGRRGRLPLPARPGLATSAHNETTMRFGDVGHGQFFVTLPRQYVGPVLADSVELTDREPLVPLRINGWEMRMRLTELRSMVQALRQSNDP